MEDPRDRRVTYRLGMTERAVAIVLLLIVAIMAFMLVNGPQPV
jgi:hypothetical protein